MTQDPQSDKKLAAATDGAAVIRLAAESGGVPVPPPPPGPTPLPPPTPGPEIQDKGPKNAGERPLDGEKSGGEKGKIDPVEAYEALSGGRLPEDGGDDDTGGIGKKARWGRDPNDPCPVRALGHMNGTFYFVDVAHQVRALDERAMGPGTMQSLFGGYMGVGSWVQNNFPPRSKRDTWNNLWLTGYLMEMCHDAGLFNPERDVRGPGVWPDGHGGLVLNCGDKVLYWPLAKKGFRPGFCVLESGVRLGGHLYCAAPPEAPPADEPATAAEAGWYLEFITRCWNWDQPLVAPDLFVGWVMAASVGGGLPKRTVLGVDGPRGTGKSELLQAAEAAIGPGSRIYEKATEPGVRRVLTKPVPAFRVVMIDEAEAKEDNRDLQKLIERARFAYDVGGGRTVIGGSDGGDVKVDAMFAFASIEPPPMEAQDLSRRIGLSLRPLVLDADGAATFAADLARAQALGPKLRARMFAEWPRFQGAFEAYHDGLLRQAGCDPRIANTYAVVLASLTLFISDAAVADVDVARWAEHVKKTRTGEAAETTTAAKCLNHLMTAEIVDKNGKRLRLGEEVRKAMFEHDDIALEVCKSYGVTIMQPYKGVRDELWYMAVADNHNGLNTIFRGTRWHGGAWKAPLLQLDGAIYWKNPLRFAGAKVRGVIIPPENVPDDAVVAGSGQVPSKAPVDPEKEVPF